MADNPVHYGGGHEDLDREIAALDAIRPKIDDFNKRRVQEVEVTDRSIGKLKGEAAARNEAAAAAERQAAAIGKLTAAQQKMLGMLATGGPQPVQTGRGGGRTINALEDRGLVTQTANGVWGATDVGALVARERNLISRVAVEAASQAAVIAKATANQYPQAAGPQNRIIGEREAVTREAIAAERDLAAASKENAAAARADAAARNAAARRQLATEGAALGTLGVFATGAGAALRFGVREQRTGQRVSGNFQTRDAAEQRIAQLTQETLGSVERTANVQRRIAVTAGMELARRERIAGMMVRYEAALRAEPVIPEERQLGPGANPLLPVRHPYGGNYDYGPRYAAGARGTNPPWWEVGQVGGMLGQNPAYDRWRNYYVGGQPPGPRGPSGEGGTRPGPLMLPQFSQSSHTEEAARLAGEKGDSFINRTRAAEAATASMGRYADAEARAAAGTRFAAAEFGTADRSMYRHGALTTEFIQAAYRGEVTMRDLGNQVGLTIGKFAGWTVAASLVYGAARAVTTLGNGAMASNSAVQELQRYIGGLDTDRAREQLRKLSEDMNVDMDTAAQQFAAAARLTGGAGSPRQAQDQAASIARTTLLLSRVGDLDPDTAMKFTSALQTGFKMSADELALFIDQMNQLQNKMNIPLDVSAGAVSRAAGTWRAAGGSPETLLALTAAARRGTGFTGEILGTTFSRSATMIGRPGNRRQLQAFGIDPDQGIDQIMEQAMRLVETHQVQGRDVIRLGTALSSPQLAGRGVVAALQNSAQYRKAQGLEDPDTAKGSAERELTRMLKSWREQIIAVANDLRQLGGALEESGLMAPLGLMLKTLNAIGDVVQFLIGGFNNLLPPGLRQGVALLIEAAAAMTVMRRLGAFRAEGALARHFPQLAALERPENQVKGLAVRGARDQVDEAERAREGAARSYSSSRIAHEVATRDLGDMQQELRTRQAGTDPRWKQGGDEHARLSRDITAREGELARLEEERAAALRNTVNHQKVVIRAKEELKSMEGMTPAEAAFYARATGTPLPNSLRIPDERGARAASEKLKTHLDSLPLTGRPGDVLKHIDDVERMLDETVTTRPSAMSRLRASGLGQRVGKVTQAMRDEIAQVHENLRPKAYVYDPQGPSAWNVGPQPDGKFYNSDTSANAMRHRVFNLDRFGPSRFDDALDSASRGAYNLGNKVGGLAKGATSFARNSKLLTGVSSLAERSLNAAVTAVDAGAGGLSRMGTGAGKLWRSLGALDKIFLGIAAWQIAESLTAPAGDAIRADYEATRARGTGARNQAERQRLAKQATEHVSGSDIDHVIIAGAGQILNPTQWDDIVGGRDAGTLRRAAIATRNAQRANARQIIAMQQTAARHGDPLPMRFSGDIARDARRLMAEQASFTNDGDYNQRMQKLQQEAEMASMEGRNPKERRRSQQRLAAVMADLAASSDDTLAVRRQIGTLDESGVQKTAQTAIANVQAYGMHGSRSRQYLLLAREAYLRAVQQEGRGTPEQLAALAQLRDQFFQGIAQTAQTDLAIALDAAGSDPSKRQGAYAQEHKDVYGQTVGVAKRSLSDAQRRRATLVGQRDAAHEAANEFASTGDSGVARQMRARERSLNARIEALNVEIGKRSDEVELMERDYKAWQIEQKHAAYQDRQQGRQTRADLRASRTDDPLAQAREQTKRTQQDYRDAVKTFGRDSPEAQQAETARNQARNNQFQAHLQDIQSKGRLTISEGPRDSVSRARATLDEARKALAYAEQHKKAHPVAYRDALVAVNEAEDSLNDAVHSRAQSIVDLRGQLAVARAHGDPMEAAHQALLAAQQLTRDPQETAQQFGLRRAVAMQNAVNQNQDATRDLHAAQGEFRASVSGDPRDQARSELAGAQQELRDATAGTAAWWRARAHVNTARRQIQQADSEMAQARLQLRRAGTDDPVAQARIDEQIARQAIKGTTGAERLRARAQLREAHRNTLQTSIQARSDTVDFNLSMEKITADQAATQLESLAKAHGIGKAMRRQLLQRAHELRKESEQEASGFALDVGTIKLPTIYDVRRAMAPLRQGADMGAAARMHAVTNMNLTINAGDGPGAEERVYAGVDRAMGTALRATMRNVQMR